MGKRGQVTELIKGESMRFLKEPITKDGIETMKYIIDCLLNNRLLNVKWVKREQISIIEQWRSLGLVDYTATKFTVTDEFWMDMCRICLMAYVNNNNFKNGLLGGD